MTDRFLITHIAPHLLTESGKEGNHSGNPLHIVFDIVSQVVIGFMVL
jgi:hypothetical protein